MTLTSAMSPVRTNTMLFVCFRCSAPHPMMVVLGTLWFHRTQASRTLGWWAHWPHWTSGMCGWAMHLLCIGEVFALPSTPIGPVFLVSFRLVPQGLTTTTLVLLLFPLGPTKRPHPPMGLKALMPRVVPLVVRSRWM